MEPRWFSIGGHPIRRYRERVPDGVGQVFNSLKLRAENIHRLSDRIIRTIIASEVRRGIVVRQPELLYHDTGKHQIGVTCDVIRFDDRAYLVARDGGVITLVKADIGRLYQLGVKHRAFGMFMSSEVLKAVGTSQVFGHMTSITELVDIFRRVAQLGVELDREWAMSAHGMVMTPGDRVFAGPLTLEDAGEIVDMDWTVTITLVPQHKAGMRLLVYYKIYQHPFVASEWMTTGDSDGPPANDSRGLATLGELVGEDTQEILTKLHGG